jgi:hypothetical protein
MQIPAIPTVSRHVSCCQAGPGVEITPREPLPRVLGPDPNKATDKIRAELLLLIKGTSNKEKVTKKFGNQSESETAMLPETPRIIGMVPWAVFVIRAGNLIRHVCCPLRPWKKHWHGTALLPAVLRRSG